MNEPQSDREQPSPQDLPTLGHHIKATDAPPTPTEDSNSQTTEMPPPERSPDEFPATPLSRVGDYEILEEIGRGGMGVVFKARDVRLNRIVALKMLSGGVLAQSEDVQRFETEASAAAQLQHPGIVGLFDVGTYEGQPYFSMEYVEGSNLAQRGSVGVLPSRLAASYLERTARAVHFAHGKGIIHRDLKPANVLLDEDDQPKITDFGLAKLYRNDSGQTRTGTVIGTPSYMAPEQANAAKDIGPACDVYSLGAILYEMLTGHPPFIGETALQTLQMVTYKEPVSPHLVNPKVDRDLETICLKCLEKEPSRRYDTAEEFANDLRRYLKGEPITARRLGLFGRAWKWVRRKPHYAAMLVVTLLALVSFGAYEWHVAENERTLRQLAELEHEEADRARRRAELAKKKAEDQERLVRDYYYAGRMQQAFLAWQNADLERATRLLAYWTEGPLDNDPRDWEWYFLNKLSSGKYTLAGHTRRVRSLAYNASGTMLASAGGPAGRAGEVKIWDPATGKQMAALPTAHAKTIYHLAFSPDGATLATVSADHTVRLWDTRRWQELAVLRHHEAHVTSVAFSPDGKTLVSGGGEGCVIRWDISDRHKPRFLQCLREHGSEITSVAFSPKGDVFASASFDETVRIWDAKTGEEKQVLRGHQGEVMSVAFSPNGKALVSGGGPGLRRGQVKLWEVATGKLLRTHYGLADRVLSVAISKHGQIAAGDSDGLVQVWDQYRSSEALRIRADTQPVYAVVYSPDGDTLATGGRSGKIRLWNRSGSQESFRRDGHPRTAALAYSPDGKLFASAGRFPRRSSILVWDIATGKKRAPLIGHAGEIHALAISPDSRYLASVGSDQNVHVHDLHQPGAPPRLFRGHRGSIMAVAFHPGGRFLVTGGGDDHTIRFWNLKTGAEIDRKQVDNGTQALAFSPNSRYLAAGDYVGKVRLWDLEKDKLQIFAGHQGWVQSIAFSPDSMQLASGGTDQTIRIWIVATGQSLCLEGATRPITALAFHPKGKRLASVGADRLVRLWDLTILQEILQLDGPEGELRTVAFSPDGSQLAAAGRHTGIYVWDAGTTRKK